MPENNNERVPEAQMRVFRMSRPVVLVDADNRILVVLSEHQRGGGISIAYSESAARDDWKFIDLSKERMGRWEPRCDPIRWQRDGIVSIYYEPEGTDSELMDAGVFEWDARSYFKNNPSPKTTPGNTKSSNVH
jgi:hypothetical protein